MIEQIKKLEKREDGFLEVNFKRVKDFDEYVFSQINQDKHCLYCMRDHRSKTKFLYDIKGYLNLTSYLENHIFEKDEIKDFFIFLFEELVKANTSKPVYLQSDFIFISYDVGNLKFLSLPLTMDKWIFQNEQSKEFLIELVKNSKVNNDYASIGLLVEMIKLENVSLPLVLKQLLFLKENQKKRMPWYYQFLHHRKEERYKIIDIPKQEVAYIDDVIPVDPMMETMVLFQDINDDYFMDIKSSKQYPVICEVFAIGRDQENQLCINDNFISGKHAVYKKETGVLEDLNSSNGTFVNKKKITQKKLNDGDIVSFAKTEFLFYKPLKKEDDISNV